MVPNFGRGLPPDQPLTAKLAVRRGHYFISIPVFAILAALWFILAVLFPNGPFRSGKFAPLLALLIVIGPPSVAWIWWSYAVPRWRRWALSAGVDPEELQRLAQKQLLVWPKGHFFEKTEFRGGRP